MKRRVGRLVAPELQAVSVHCPLSPLHTWYALSSVTSSQFFARVCSHTLQHMGCGLVLFTWFGSFVMLESETQSLSDVQYASPPEQRASQLSSVFFVPPAASHIVSYHAMHAVVVIASLSRYAAASFASWRPVAAVAAQNRGVTERSLHVFFVGTMAVLL
eukprot:CAMPEP_0180129198 /NCGR_PEP_ID=MMETSP0986-20121125/7184_1 /TAXON_ID=697907 /ORGANISM="non described non described, Strain CCMP2293" /LENGTH=159 /DNA_ID=CAMNT_0022068843 /DNA_START=553 /DNA_END=1032 /DNA_ORIENTATION=-